MLRQLDKDCKDIVELYLQKKIRFSNVVAILNTLQSIAI